MKAANLHAIRPLVLVCLSAVALTAGACGDASGIPTRPNPSVAVGPAISGTAEAPEDPAAADRPAQLPFHGSLQGIDTDSVSFPFLSVRMEGTGEATHLGNYTAVIDFRVDLRAPTSPAVGSFTFTAANGDTIIGDLVGRASIVSGIATVAETATITGGTGRFATATGSFVTARTVVQATGITSGSFDGTIQLRD